MKKLKAQSVRNPSAQLKRAALVRADDEARRIPCQRLWKPASNTSTGRSFNSGCAQFSRLKALFPIGWLKSSTTVVQDSWKATRPQYQRQQRPGLSLSAWKTGLTN